ncbi:unnamed protein product [Meloidogyne enterolobii]|uniref:Uncharacterized protein n=1 Tax=Meloidogyne enterolobii TaxID=390850 RepID=A0ACB1AP06_MELEN
MHLNRRGLERLNHHRVDCCPSKIKSSQKHSKVLQKIKTSSNGDSLFFFNKESNRSDLRIVS